MTGSSEFRAQVQCYCVNGPDGHLHDPPSGHYPPRDFSCPPTPQPRPVGFADDHGAALRQMQERSDADRVLADLFRRVLKADLVQVRTHFFPTWHLTLEAGEGRFTDAEINLTDAEIDVLRGIA